MTIIVSVHAADMMCIIVSVCVALIKRTFHEQTIVFIQTKKEAHRMHIVLGLLGVRVGELHGGLSQTQVRLGVYSVSLY